MSKVLSGLKSLGISLSLGALLLLALTYFQALWQPWQAQLSLVPFGLLTVVFLFASQFNRSRIALLSLLWLLFYLGLQFTVPWSGWLTHHRDWLLLFGAWALLSLLFMQDRGLLSLHGIARLAFFVALAALSYGWQQASLLLAERSELNWLPKLVQEHLALEVPVLLALLVFVVRSIWRPGAVVNAIAISFLLWCTMQFNWLVLPWSLMLTLLSLYYLLVVISDSYFLAYRDELTGLPSRRALNQLALALARKYTVAMLDIDHFKKFNDTYGHDIGDQVLKLVAAKLSKVKSGGRVFRYGGEEFTVVFPGKRAEQAMAELEALRQSVADYQMIIRQPVRQSKKQRGSRANTQEKTVSVTISIGVASKGAKQGFTEVLKAADQALYRAKNKGRNNVSD